MKFRGVSISESPPLVETPGSSLTPGFSVCHMPPSPWVLLSSWLGQCRHMPPSPWVLLSSWLGQCRLGQTVLLVRFTVTYPDSIFPSVFVGMCGGASE